LKAKNNRKRSVFIYLLSYLLVASLIQTIAPAAVKADSGTIPLATGSGVNDIPEPQGPFYVITDYGAASGGSATSNQSAINNAIMAAEAAGGGTVVIPEGDFRTYTIRLKSNVGLHFESNKSILRAAVQGTGANQDGGFYDAPEPNLYIGLQDHGHSHFANSLIYGDNVENVMISGQGLIDGSYINQAGVLVNVLSGSDPREVSNRNDSGTAAGANKAVAIVNSKNITLRDINIKNGGHFGIIGTGVFNWTIEGIVVDTNRDALNVDSSQNVTIRNSVFNSMTDDAIVLKASFGAGKFITTKNVLIENNTVSGYDAGSVLAGVYSTEKLVATDLDGPTARIKLGTEGTNGFDTVTIRNCIFDRSRGFALESVDGSELQNIVLTDSIMNNVSSSPIFIRIGDRGRSPVTGISSDESANASNNIRLDDTGWVLPNLIEKYGSFPAMRYIPSYSKNTSVSIEGGSNFSVVNQANPTRLNPNSIHPDDFLYANAVGPAAVASAHDISISNVIIKNVDPRYPILLAGLMDNPIRNVNISNIQVEYRGGLKMEHAVEQRQLNQPGWSYSQYQSAPATQTLPWLVNTFFSKNEALLPRISWDPAKEGGAGWVDDPYNVPEMPREYPEPSQFGILPAYGIYARHVDGLNINNVTLRYKLEDERPAVVLDDVNNAVFQNFNADTKADVPTFVKVTNTKKRGPVLEYVKDQPYRTTRVTNLTIPQGLAVQEVNVDRPAPGTPPDSLYSYPTVPSAEFPYAYAVPNASYPKPLTVYRPSFEPILNKSIEVGQLLQFAVNAKTPATGVTLTYSADNLPEGASFNPATQTFSWLPGPHQAGTYTVEFVVHDGVLPERKSVNIDVLQDRNISAALSGPQNVASGQSFDVNYGLTYVKDSIYAQDITVVYEPSVVEFVYAEPLKNSFVIPHFTEGPGMIRILAVSLGEGNAVNTDGDLLKLHFRVKPSISTSTGAEISVSNLIIADGDGNETQAEGASFTIQIQNNTGIPGDFNGDEMVSIGDLAIVAKYYGKTSEDPDWNQYKSADLNNDGVIDIADLVILARKILEM
jgi:polygalacturonase